MITCILCWFVYNMEVDGVYWQFLLINLLLWNVSRRRKGRVTYWLSIRTVTSTGNRCEKVNTQWHGKDSVASGQATRRQGGMGISGERWLKLKLQRLLSNEYQWPQRRPACSSNSLVTKTETAMKTKTIQYPVISFDLVSYNLPR